MPGDDRSRQDSAPRGVEFIDLEGLYRIERTITSRHLCSVLLATDRRSSRRVVIKHLNGGDSSAVQRFLDAAKQMASLDHPNIVRVYDYGWAEQGPFSIMEYCQAGSLLSCCEAGPLPLDKVIDFACQICSGLEEAHDRGIVHGNIRPSNIVLTKDGVAKLTNFGHSKLPTNKHALIASDHAIHDCDFMSPEQRGNEPRTDHRSDLWSVAATVYQMITGSSPEPINRLLIPPALAPLLETALQYAPESRYQSARELREALQKSKRRAPLSAAFPTEIAEGQCVSCGAYNSPTRILCVTCGAALETWCLSCTEPMPIWQNVCGECRASQLPIVHAKNALVAEAETEAEGLLNGLAFDSAEAIVAPFLSEAHPRLSHHRKWAELFTAEIQKARAEQREKVADAVQEALEREKAYDYAAAIEALLAVPKPLLQLTLPTLGYSAEKVLLRLEENHTRSLNLEQSIAAAIDKGSLPAVVVQPGHSLAALLEKVKALTALHPNRADVAQLCTQLEERLQGLAARRDELRQQATAAFHRRDFEASRILLGEINPEVMTDDLRGFVKDLLPLAQRSASERSSIAAAYKAEKYEGLLQRVEQYLALYADSEQITTIRSELEQRAQRLAAENQAQQLASAAMQEALLEREAVRRTRRDTRSLWIGIASGTVFSALYTAMKRSDEYYGVEAERYELFALFVGAPMVWLFFFALAVVTTRSVFLVVDIYRWIRVMSDPATPGCPASTEADKLKHTL